MRFRTKAIHVGNERDPATGAVVPPLHPASTFVQHKAGEWRDYDYSRSGNPTRSNAQQTLAALENGCGSLLFASGMAATHTVTMLLSAGDHIVAGTDTYGGTYRLLHQICSRSGIEVSHAPTQDLNAVAAAMTDATKLVWIESPGNPLLSITDIAACAKLAHDRGALLGVDSTFATPVLTRPLDLGADIVMHSATKYLGGHSDLMAGALVVKEAELLEKLYFITNATGNALNPWEAFLLSRGMKTLDIRVRHQCQSACEIAYFLAEDVRVRRVFYPGLATHPGHEVAAQQMDGLFGAMMSIELDGGFDTAKQFVESTRLFQLAVSLGAVESLIEQPASMSHASYAPEDRAANGITDSLVRLSVGLEDVADLKADLEQALAR
jgi:cystathionine beta-lyase/cystathionine gamma-synthase